ncbi:hypothetical protein [Streptomyces abikoensis]|uniref:hypothetical protein n=1 Tax=Streptomyces abikoensis TaxID=97398 RepID=UPI001673B1D3|nr:hypothetical protein [Streptomyces abikoensis]GGP40545.1 hypothetical protein GCM10010214_12400 [Streptomyces abikoensis]
MEEWERACERGSEVAASYLGKPDDPRGTWEWTAVTGILSMTFAALGKSIQGGVDAVGLGTLLWHLQQGPGHLRALVVPLVGDRLAAGTDTAPDTVGAADDPVVARWLWLTRTWPEAAHAHERPAPGSAPRWDGLQRVYRREHQDPAVDIGTDWALMAANAALTLQRGGIAPQTRVRIVGGGEGGGSATVILPAWELDDEARDVNSGPPPSYLVRLGATGDRSVQFEPLLVSGDRVRVLELEDEQAPFGADRTFTTVWGACSTWAGALVNWHRVRTPAAWSGVDTGEAGRLPLVNGLVTLALFVTTRAEGLDDPADGTAVPRTPLMPATDLLPGRFSGLYQVDELLNRVISDVGQQPERGPLEEVRSLWKSFERTGREVREWAAWTAHEVLLAHAGQLRVPVGLSARDILARLSSGQLQVTLADRAEDLVADAQQRSHDALGLLFEN